MKRFKILFLCTGNSARSILAEFLMARLGSERFEAVSAGSDPKVAPHPLALRTLREHFQIDVSAARSKSWKEFDDETFDFVITLCDDAREICPVWPGRPILAHWGSPDPAAAVGTEAERADVFWQVARQIYQRLSLLTSLPFEELDELRLTLETKAIGERARLDFDCAQPNNES
jgi:arsenate reductase